MKGITLSRLLIIYIIAISLIVFPLIYIEALQIFKSIFEKNTTENAKSIANQTFNSMSQIMKRGWTRKGLLEFLESLKIESKNYDVEIYRTKIVEKLFGKINQPALDKDLMKAIKEKKDITKKEDGKLRYIMPVKANQICLKCHTNAKVGDVLGIVEVRYNLKDVLSKAENKFSQVLLLILPLPLIVVVFLTYFIGRKIGNNLKQLNNKIEKISNLEDIKKIPEEKVDFLLEDFNELFEDIKKIVYKLQNVAVDKEVLEFEIKILQKFIITSDVVQDWKKYIAMLLIEINQIIPAVNIFLVFKEKDGYNAEIFWRGKPSKKLKILTENLIKEKIKEHFHLVHDSKININHNIVEKDRSFLDIEYKYIKFTTKSIFIEKPHIGGIIGLGVQLETKNDYIKQLVIGNILTTLLNFIGSVKAINRYTKELEYYATRDPLTNLYNQRVFWELLKYELYRAKRHKYKFSLIVIDIDNFKLVNDSYGHDFEDKFLVEVANLLRHTVRPSDVIARYGGDEFVIILPETDSQGAYIVANRILKAAENYQIQAPDGKTINPMFSIGIATYPEHAENIEELFSIADSMMYKAKMEGKGKAKIPTEEDITEIFKEESEMTAILMDVIRNKSVLPYFQPIVDTKSGKIKAYELLSRLEKDGEIIPASKFVDIAEKTGLIFKMDLIVIEKAFEKIKDTNKNLFINLTPKALIYPEYLEKIKELVKKYNINPENIVFEITERETVRNISLLKDFVLYLKELGFKFAIDDFGSGFSSFYYVKQFPIDFVKIEGEFIRNMVKDEKDRAFVESIVILCKKIGIKTVAEYVELKEIYDLIKEIGIDYAQGYYLGKPSPDLKTDEKGE